ncbi:MAG: right-handed parallel beta-helix repeat-containing protein [Tannerella sp.]|nr:right-handed parallel beta-helix repeat-containing protein [Tannerella sp.]
MKKNVLCFLVGVLVLMSSCSEDIRLYVSPAGNDAGAGTASEPLQTLEGARRAVRGARAAHPGKRVTVYFGGGIYPLEQTVRLTAEDSGSERAPVTYRAAEGEIPVFTGGKPLAQWSVPEDARTLERLAPSIRDSVYVTDLAAAGITGFGDPTDTGKRPELVCNGRFQTLARWPDGGFVRAGLAKGATVLPETYIKEHGTKEGVFEYADARQNRWTQEEDARLGGYWYWDWKDEYQRVARLDTGTRTVHVAEPYHSSGYRDSLRYFGLNLFCELDRPGEWYLNRSTGLLYWYPPEGVDPAAAEVSLTCFSDSFMVDIHDCAYVTFEGLTFREGRGSAVRITDGTHNLLSDCRLERFGVDGVQIEGGTHHGATGCYLSSFGHGGFKIAGGDRKTLTPCDHFVDHTVVEDFSILKRTYEPAVFLEGCGARIAHNRFRNSSSSAMRLEGNDFVIEYNEVSRVVSESDDQGGIDMWNNPSYRGVVIRYNRWSDITGGTRHGAAGIRFDDMISGLLVYGNLFERCGAAEFGGVQIHGGKDNRVENNVFYQCRFAVSFTPWGEERWLKALDSEYIRKKIYQDVDIRSDVYLQKYPELRDIRLNPDVNTVTDNLVISCTELFRKPGNNRIDRNTALLDTGEKGIDAFCTPEELATYGLQPILVAEIGPKKNRWTVQDDAHASRP